MDKEKKIQMIRIMTLAVNLHTTSSFGLTKFLPCISIIIIINGSLKNKRVGGRLQFGLTA